MNKILSSVLLLGLSVPAQAADFEIMCFPTVDRYSVESANVYGMQCITQSMGLKPEQVLTMKQTEDDNMIASFMSGTGEVSVKLVMFYPDYDLAMIEVMK